MRRITVIAISAMALLLGVPRAWAAASEVSSTLTPAASYIWVDGDNDKFRAHRWVDTGLEGGIQEFTLEQEDMGNDWSIWGEGHALLNNNDYAFEAQMQRDDLVKVDFHFQQFRKYYDSSGGVYPGFDKLSGYDANRELYMDIGKLALTYSLTPDDLPDLHAGYEFEYKRGTKSRLTWASAQEGSVSKKILPSWQEIDEDVHVFELGANDTWKGTSWEIEQKWEQHTTHSTRREINAATASTASLNKLRDQELVPHSSVMETTVGLERWLIKDKLHGAARYRYGQIETDEWESIFEMTADGVPANFSNAENVREAVAENYLRTHTGVASLVWTINNAWTAIGRFKIEEATKRGASTHPMDRAGAAPDGVIDQNDISETSDGILRTGEALSLRFSGIPRVSLYNDLELEQVENSMQENRQSNSAGEVFARQTDGFYYRGTETFGLNWWPNDRVKLNAHYRFRRENGDLDDVFETDPASTGAKSAFVDRTTEVLNEVASRLSVKWCDGFEPGLRYQLRKQDLGLRFEADPLELESTSLSHIYTFDVALQPTAALTLVPGLQFQEAQTRTPAVETGPTSFPAFNSDVWTAMLGASYAVNADTAITGSFQYQQADNFNFDAYQYNGQVPYGSDYDQWDVTVGVRWTGWKKGVSLEPRYGYYHYDAEDLVEFGEYDAHVAWLSVKIDWA